jgi:GT2 family glycosyltransferase
MDVSIIYVNYKTHELILNSIQTVKRQTKDIDYEIIVVDNHSEDDSLPIIKNSYPDVICVQSADNIGFGRANNLGLEVAQGECILFLNPDTLLLNNAIEILCRHLQSSEQIGACGGNLYDENKNPANSFSRKFPSYAQELLSILYLQPFCLKANKSYCFNYTNQALEVALVIGADLMVKKTVLEEAGAFDPDFFLNFEEIELCYRIRKVGYKIVSFPDAMIMHLEGRSSYISQSRLFFLYQGEFIYFNKIFGKNGAKIIYCLTQLKNNIRIFQFSLLRNKEKMDYWRMKKKTNEEAFRPFEENINIKK